MVIDWLRWFFGLGDLFTGDQEPYIGVHQVPRSTTTSCVKLWWDSQTKMDQRLRGAGLAQRHEQQFDTARVISSVFPTIRELSRFASI